MLSACSESAKNAKLELNKLREDKAKGDAEFEQKVAAKLKLDQNIRTFMEERWAHYMQ